MPNPLRLLRLIVLVSAFAGMAAAGVFPQTASSMEARSEGKKVTGLVQAAISGDLKLVERYLDRGTPVDVRNKAGETALMWACRGGNAEMVGLLLKRGADVNAGTKTGWTSLMMTYQYQPDRSDIADMLIRHGANVNMKEKQFGSTPLIAALTRGDIKSARHLLSRGADVNVSTHVGITPLMMACAAGDEGIVRELVEKGADINARANTGADALMAAAARGSIPIVAYLLDKGAPINGRAYNGWTALTSALFQDQHEMVEFLRKRGGTD
ncbi:MAG: ankyrin repeat domain-containing protein [Pseudomonadota bacterium]